MVVVVVTVPPRENANRRERVVRVVVRWLRLGHPDSARDLGPRGASVEDHIHRHTYEKE